MFFTAKAPPTLPLVISYRIREAVKRKKMAFVILGKIGFLVGSFVFSLREL